VLMKQQRFAEAEQVYRDDLTRLPENGWSLLGLAESLRKQKKNADEASRTQAKFKRVCAKADLPITSSLFLPAGSVTTAAKITASRKRRGAGGARVSANENR
jgi:cytochrome c-type biogenesis protein CcmH/NrfG